MLSKEETQLLDRFLREVPPRGRISDTEFNEEQVQKLIESLNFNHGDLSRGWKQFFRSRSKDILDAGEATGETEEQYRLAPDMIVDEWAEEIDNRPWFAETRLENVDEESWRLTVEPDGFVDLTFRLFFDGERVEAYSPDVLKGKFAVWFVRPQTLLEADDTFKWTEFLKDDFWDSVRQYLLRVQTPRTEEICRKDSVAANDNMEGIQASIKTSISNSGMEVANHPEEDVTSIEQYIDGPILFGAKEDDSSYLLVCECDLSPDHIHFHYFRDGAPAFLRKSTHADDISKSVRKSVEEYNKLSAEKKDVYRALRAAGIALGGLGVAQTIPFFTFFGINPNSQFVSGVIVIGLVFLILGATALFIYLFWPIIAFRNFSWEEGRLK